MTESAAEEVVLVAQPGYTGPFSLDFGSDEDKVRIRDKIGRSPYLVEL